jgi:Ca2+-binding EF-hand superfamily protein
VPNPFRLTLAPLMLVALASAASAQTTASQPHTRTRAEVTQNLDSKFKLLDSNHDGSVTKAEMEAAEGRAKQEAEARLAQQADQSFTKLDTDKNGQLSLAEFKASLPSIRTRPVDAVLQRFDTNKDGKVTLQEFGAPTLALFDRFDTNKDGTISDQERNARRGSGR